jgi:hypothetical protein
MRLFELFEDLEPNQIKDIETNLNRKVYMPQPALQHGDPVLKLNLPVNQHFGGRATGDNSGRLSHETSDFTGDDVEDLLFRARTDPSLGYEDDLEKFASFPGPGDYPSDGHGYQIKNPKNNLLIPVVVKPNPNAKRLVSKTTVATDKGLEPRNILKAKTIMFYRPRSGENAPKDNRYNVGDKKANNSFKPPFKKPFIAPIRRRPDMSDYDDESTD